MLLKNLFQVSKLCKNVLKTSTIRNVCGLTERCARIETSFRQKLVRVTVLGAESPTGEMLSFLLKQNPIISQVYLYGDGDVMAIAADLRHMDTTCQAEGYCGDTGISSALRRADIVVMLGMDLCPLGTDVVTVFRQETQRVLELADSCTKYAPKAVIVVCAPPIAATTNLVAQIFKETHWYHPGRIIGSAALVQTRANSLSARFQDLDPNSVHVPLVGGPDPDQAVPLFSRATPVPLLPSDCELLFERIRQCPSGLNPVRTPEQCKFTNWAMSEAYSLNHLVTTIGLGLCGDANAICAAFVRQNMINTCTHLVSTVKFGTSGVVHNYGIPVLSKMEFKQFEQVTYRLNKLEKMALDTRASMLKVKLEKGPPYPIFCKSPKNF